MTPKLKKFEIDWTAEISGREVIEAFDEDDAQEQFDTLIMADRMPNEPVHASVLWVTEVKPERKPRKSNRKK